MALVDFRLKGRMKDPYRFGFMGILAQGSNVGILDLEKEGFENGGWPHNFG